MKHCDDGDAIRLVDEIDRIRKFLKQGAAYVVTHSGKAKRIIGNLFKSIANPGDEAGT